MATPAKFELLKNFSSVERRERRLQCYFQFIEPTGANAVEEALKLSRKVTGSKRIISFTHGYCDARSGAIAASGDRINRAASKQESLAETLKLKQTGKRHGL